MPFKEWMNIFTLVMPSLVHLQGRVVAYFVSEEEDDMTVKQMNIYMVVSEEIGENFVLIESWQELMMKQAFFISLDPPEKIFVNVFDPSPYK
ncbi:hypothetical protein HAX54_053528, partial [Datura stramonium]|nr:hypothetical protein [Datura stramonium]